MNSVIEKLEQSQRKLRDLAGIGARIEANLHRLGVHNVAELAGQDSEELYRRLGEIEGVRPDPCVLDVFRCTIAQARDPLLRPEQRNWWWWSRERKAGRIPDVS